MESIYSLFKSYEDVKSRKANVNDLIERLNKEIYDDCIKLHRIQNINYNNEINDLEEKKHFLENYPKYMKKGVKGFFKTLFSALGSTAVLFIFLLIAFWIMSFEVGFKIELLWADLLISATASTYMAFIEPIVYNYKTREDILFRYGDIEYIDLELERVNKRKRDSEERRVSLDQGISSKRRQVECLTNYYNQLNSLEDSLNIKLQNGFDKVLEDIARDYYIYEADTLEIGPLLKLTK